MKALFRACRQGDLQSVQEWLPLSKDQPRLAGRVFREACVHEQFQIAEYARARGIDPHWYYTALWGSCRLGRLGAVRYLVSLGVDHRREEDRAWRKACLKGQVPVMEYLFALGVEDESVKQALRRYPELADTIRSLCERRDLATSPTY